MKPSGKVVEPIWDRSYRDQTPSEADLSDYDPGFIATANLDISNRFDPTEFRRTPFTIAQGRAAKAKSKPTTPLLQPFNTKVDDKKEEKKGKSKPKKSILGKENIDTTEDDAVKRSIEDSKEDTEDSQLKKKKKPKKIKFGGYSSYAEWDAAEDRADRAGGPPIAPAAIQLPPPKKEEKKLFSNSYQRQATGWVDARGHSKAPSKPFPKTGFTTAAALAGTSNSSKKRKTPTAPAPSILQALDAIDKDKVKKPKTTTVPEKKEPAKRGKASAKGSRGRGKGKKDAEEPEPSLKFSRLPAGAGPTDDFPIIKGFERMKSLPVKQRPAQVDLDKLIPSTRKELEKHKKGKVPSSNKNKTFKSDEIILDDDNDNESVDPPSDTDATLHVSSATLKGSSKPKWFSALFEGVPQEVKTIPSPNPINPPESNHGSLTPDAESQLDNGNPSTMTHISVKPHRTDYATSSSKLPYSSPVVNKYGRSGNAGIINPIPIRDKSSQIANLQKMAIQGQSREIGYDRKPFSSPGTLPRHPTIDRELSSSSPEDDEIVEEEEEWSTLKNRSRYANKSMNRKDDYTQSSSRPMTALFPQQGPTQQDRKPVPSGYSKTTVFQPPVRPAQQSTGYTIAAIPNGARKIEQRQHQQYQVEEMQWTGTPRRNMELQNPKPKDLSYLRTAEAARPDPGEDWKNEWKGQKVKKDISNNPLGGYALKKDLKRGEVNGQGRAFRM